MLMAILCWNFPKGKYWYGMKLMLMYQEYLKISPCRGSCIELIPASEILLWQRGMLQAFCRIYSLLKFHRLLFIPHTPWLMLEQHLRCVRRPFDSNGPDTWISFSSLLHISPTESPSSPALSKGSAH